MITENQGYLDTDAVAQQVVKVLRQHLHEVHLRDVQVSTGLDHDGDEVLYIDVYFDLSAPLDASHFHNLTSLVREALQASGESRFPHLRYHFHAQQKVAGWT